MADRGAARYAAVFVQTKRGHSRTRSLLTFDVKLHVRIWDTAASLWRLFALLLILGAGGANASTNHGPIESAAGEFSDLASLKAGFAKRGIDMCHSQGYPSCTLVRVDFGAWGVDDQNSASASSPPLGTFSSRTQFAAPRVILCRSADGTNCLDGTSWGGWGTFSTQVCPENQVWETFTDGSSRCVPYGNRNLDIPWACHPSVGRPIDPLTGVQRHDIPLGISIGGIDLKVTYDTRDQLPETSGDVPWVDAPVPSFGAMWQSNVHRSMRLQGASTTPGAAYTGLTLQRGGNNNESYAPSGGTDTCGGSVAGTSGSYASSVDPRHQVVFNGTSGRLVDQNELTEQVFASDGTLTAVSNAQGGVSTYTYSTSVTSTAPAVGLLTSVADQFGRTVQFAYELPPLGGLAPRVTKITGADGQVTTASYDPSSGNLTGLTWPDGKTETFVYELTNLPWALTGIIDENTARYVTLGYDPVGRANSSQLAGGVESYNVQYDPSPSVAPHWQVDETFIQSVPVVCRVRHWVTPPLQLLTDPAGQSIAYGEASNLGRPMPTSLSQPAGSGCSASSSAQAYDTSNNPTSRDDFNGNRTCYAYDLTRNLATSTLEGLPTTKACPADLSVYAPSTADISHPERKTTTVWHPDWVLKIREAQPKKLTTWVYNGQPDPVSGGTASCASTASALPDGKPIAVLCARYEQATTDATGAFGVAATVTGATRAWTYTYNQFGQVLTETTPKQSPTDALSHKTTYAYYSDTSMSSNVGHTIGDLQSVTNPLGQATNYTSYNGAGRVLSSIDANSTVTSQTYWPRGWLHTQTVTTTSGAALTTTYDYWPTGLLKTVTMPDASTLNYAYDDAHRLTDITDAAGNKIHYVLDNVGNRTGEQISDASGNLASTVSRVFDALNRVQTQTGLAR